MTRKIVSFIAILAVLILAQTAEAATWKETGTDTALTIPTGSVTSPSLKPGQSAYVEYSAGGSNPPPLDVRGCYRVHLFFHPDYGGNGSTDAEVQAWNCHEGAPTIDPSAGGFSPNAYCNRSLQTSMVVA